MRKVVKNVIIWVAVFIIALVGMLAIMLNPVTTGITHIIAIILGLWIIFPAIIGWRLFFYWLFEREK